MFWTLLEWKRRHQNPNRPFLPINHICFIRIKTLTVPLYTYRGSTHTHKHTHTHIFKSLHLLYLYINIDCFFTLTTAMKAPCRESQESEWRGYFSGSLPSENCVQPQELSDRTWQALHYIQDCLFCWKICDKGVWLFSKVCSVCVCMWACVHVHICANTCINIL